MDKQSKHSPGRLRVITLLAAIFALFATSGALAQPDGQKLFKANCAACHGVTSAKLVGPGLAGVNQRWPDREKLKSWIRNSAEYLKTGDSYANSLFEEYNRSLMPSFEHLKEEELEAILSYIENPPVPAGAAGGASVSAADKQDTPATSALTLFVLAVILLILVLILSGVRKTLRKVVNEKLNLPEPIPVPLPAAVRGWINRNSKLTAFLILILIFFGLKQGWDGLMGVGVYTGYAPEQPINFSHKIHAGENGIACVYCHSSAEKSRHAGIPSANVCMNCHKGIQEGTTTGKEEIAKIYAALDYDPATGTYGNNPKPIRWVRVHNLPDLAYFNHAQHVNVAGVECQTCHGPIQEMDIVKQHSPLTMGWCINCHRETEVKTEGNAYYDDFHKRLVEAGVAFKANPGSTRSDNTKLTVDKIGGLECAKCHY
jgi:mono/diheme cytochrome c family protein